MEKFARYLELKQDKEWLVVLPPCFDESLRQSIKNLPSAQRQWDAPCWKVFANENNLQLVQQICRDCCDRRGWIFVDRFSPELKTIQQSQAEETQLDREQHVNDVLDVLPDLPRSALKLVFWDKDTLEVQLMLFVERSLFFDFGNACLEFWKPPHYSAEVPKRTVRFTFTLAADPRIVRSLINLPHVDFLRVRSLTLIQPWADGTAHLLDEVSGNVWVGLRYQQVDLSNFNQSLKSYEVSATPDEIYWVANRDRFIEDCLKQTTTLGMNQLRLIARLEQFHLVEWFKSDWGEALLLENSVFPVGLANQLLQDDWIPEGYEHPADSLIGYLSNCPDELQEILALLEIDVSTYQSCVELVQTLKIQAAERAIAQARSIKSVLAVPYLQVRCRDKQALVYLAQQYGIYLKRSWRREQMENALLHCGELCEDLIGLPRSDVLED